MLDHSEEHGLRVRHMAFLSLTSDGEQRQFISWAEEHPNKQSDEFQQRFRPGTAATVGSSRMSRSDYPSSLLFPNGVAVDNNGGHQTC